MTKYLYYSNGPPQMFRITGLLTRILNRLWQALLYCLPPITRERLLLKAHKYSYRTGVGLRHNLSHQENVITEALFLGRMPILPPFVLGKEHNFGHWVDGEHKNFYDLEHSQIHYRHERRRHIAQPLSYIQSHDFFSSCNFKRRNILLVPHDQRITDEDNKKYRLIIRQQGGRGAPLNLSSPIFKKAEDRRWQVAWMETDRIRRLGDQVCDQLGDFYALHYRVPDGMNYNNKLPSEPLDKLREFLPTLFPSGKNLYILSNAWNQPDYFNGLKEIYQVYTYNDFPQLKQFIHLQSPNTFLLLAIELYIIKKARKYYEIRGKNKEWMENELGKITKDI